MFDDARQSCQRLELATAIPLSDAARVFVSSRQRIAAG